MKTIVWTISLMLLMTGSSFGKNDIRFCGFGESLESKDALRIDLDGRRLMGSDAASHLDVIENKVAVGFIGEFPLSLPRHQLSAAQAPTSWQMGGYRFTATSLNSADPDWLLIYAVPTSPKQSSGAMPNSSVLYSQSTGVVAIRQTFFPEGKKVVQEFYSCGKQHLNLSSFSRNR